MTLEKKAPGVVFLNITNKCNLRCTHCYLSSAQERDEELTGDEWKKILEELTEYGVKKFRINGGEPLVRTDVYEILHHAKKLATDTTLVTNATLINPETIEKLCPSLDIIYFSVDGAVPETHDKQRLLPGLFDRVMSAIDLCKERGLAVGVFSSVSKINAYNIEKLVEILNDKGVQRTAFFYCSPFGRGKEYWEQLALNPAEWNDVYKRIQNAVNKQTPKMRVFIEPRFRHVDEPKNAACSLYDKDICSIDPEGDVYFCSTTIDWTKKWSLGNLRTQRFTDIWDSSPKWEWIKSQRKMEVDARCTGCSKINACGGGCTASNLINQTEYLGTWQDDCGREYYPICFMKWEEVKPNGFNLI
jgi:radical SAM protein with 4Fe4S-binding SPASM domain